MESGGKERKRKREGEAETGRYVTAETGSEKWRGWSEGKERRLKRKREREAETVRYVTAETGSPRGGGVGVWGQGEEEEERGGSRDCEVCYSRQALRSGGDGV